MLTVLDRIANHQLLLKSMFIVLFSCLFFLLSWVVMSRFYTIVTPLKYDIVHVSAPLSYTSKQAINEAIQKSSLNHFFDIDLDALQNQLESFSWIAQVDIRRQWPAKLLLHIQEHRPIAQFNQTQWLNESGELFEAESEPNVAQLPHIMAPENQLLSVHRNLLAIQALCHKFNATLLTLTLDVRGAWQVKLDNGMQLFLGRKFILERLERFFQILPTLNVNSSQQPYIDLRYRSGFSVGYFDEGKS